MKDGKRREGEEADASCVRLDVYLDVACIYPTRSQAKEACEGGKVDLNGAAAKPHRTVKPGDRLQVTVPGRRRNLLVKAVTDRHVPKAEARTLYEESTPEISPEQLEARRLERLLAPRRDASAGKLSRREREDRSRLRGW
jgi:ribosome-associated heat shock protein Hsp15